MDVAARTTLGDVAAAATVGGWKGNRGPPLRMRPRDGHVGRRLRDAAARDGCGQVVAKFGGRRNGGLLLRTRPSDGQEDVASVPWKLPRRRLRVVSLRRGRGASLQTRPWDDRGGHHLCRRGCAGRPLGMSYRTDEAAGWLRCYRCKRRRGACLQAVARKILHAVKWPRSLFAFVDAADATVDIHTSNCTPLFIGSTPNLHFF